MRINTEIVYAIVGLRELQKNTGGTYITAEAVGLKQGIPLLFLHRIFLKLVKAGMLERRKGRTGGYRLGAGSMQFTLSDVCKALNRPLFTVKVGRSLPTSEREGAVQLFNNIQTEAQQIYVL